MHNINVLAAGLSRKFVECIGSVLNWSIGIIALLSFTSLMGCRKLVEVPPPVTEVTGASAFSSDATAIAVANGLYTKISGQDYIASYFDISTMSFWMGLSADELTLWDGVSDARQLAFYNNNLTTTPNFEAGPHFWYNIYANIYICNSLLEGINNSSSLTEPVRKQLLGEVKFIRGVCYFHLMNIYGDVPLVLTTDYALNSGLSRNKKEDVYKQIVLDLKDAEMLLNSNYVDVSLLNTTSERTRPTKWAAKAFLARVYLYSKEWSNAELESTDVIQNTALFNLVPLNEAFGANNEEAIWQLQPVKVGWNTDDARIFIVPSTGLNPDNPVSLSPMLLSSFEIGDERRTKWVDSVMIDLDGDPITPPDDTIYFPGKYKINAPDAPLIEYLSMLRLSEQYLIRAEARAQQIKIQGAQDDLNVIRDRAGLKNTAANTQPALLTAIMHERQVELFTEAGHRWFDLKRTATIDKVMSVAAMQKGTTWNTNWQWYPLPISDIQADRSLIQNPGY